jgi:DNA modification methylase
MDDGACRLMLGDCLKRMGEIADGTVDLIAADLPYGTTRVKWDSVIPLGPLWEQYRRVLVPGGVVALTASQPFTSALVMSNPEWFRYELICDKGKVTGFLDARRKPLKCHEAVCVFSDRQGVYNPQMVRGNEHRRGGRARRDRPNETWNNFTDTITSSDEYFPRSILRFSWPSVPIHPNEKPVALFEYLIKTYSDPGALVLDNTCGSGTTGIACLNTDRRFIGIERDPAIFEVARARIAAHRAATPLLT